MHPLLRCTLAVAVAAPAFGHPHPLAAQTRDSLRNAPRPAPDAQLAGHPLIDAENTPTSSGSGFYVSGDGIVVTNRHVVRGCHVLRARSDSGVMHAAQVVAMDSANDLAILHLSGDVPLVPSLRDGPAPRPGDDVVVAGYPLNGLLADQVNVTTGDINALAGLYNDARQLQMSAPVQPGSSGGPLFDGSGNVIGVVVTKLNAKVVADAMGDIPQNVNFAIKEAMLREFLDAHQVRYQLAPPAPQAPPRSHADIGDVGRRVTVLVQCWR